MHFVCNISLEFASAGNIHIYLYLVSRNIGWVCPRHSVNLSLTSPLAQHFITHLISILHCIHLRASSLTRVTTLASPITQRDAERDSSRDSRRSAPSLLAPCSPSVLSIPRLADPPVPTDRRCSQAVHHVAVVRVSQ